MWTQVAIASYQGQVAWSDVESLRHTYPAKCYWLRSVNAQATGQVFNGDADTSGLKSSARVLVRMANMSTAHQSEKRDTAT